MIIDNLSDRFLAKMSGVTPNGNSQSKVLDSLRKLHGAVPEEVWPSNIDEFSWNEFYSSIPQDIVDSGYKFVEEYEVGYEAVWSTPNALKAALQYSPLYVAGYAWSFSNGFYRSGSPNHAFTLVGYVDGVCWFAYDSYYPFIKKLAWDYKFFYPKVITLNKRGEVYNLMEIKNLINRGFRWILRAEGAGEIYELKEDGLKYISAECWNNLQVQLSADAKKLVGITEDLYNKLLV